MSGARLDWSEMLLSRPGFNSPAHRLTDRLELQQPDSKPAWALSFSAKNKIRRGSITTGPAQIYRDWKREDTSSPGQIPFQLNVPSKVM